MRNPWAYYVSWYEFQKTLKTPTFVWRVFSEEGRLGFSETVRRMLYCGEDKATVERLIELAPQAYSDTGVNITRQHLGGLAGISHGWYTFLFNHMYGDCPVEFIKTEHLRQDFFDYLGKHMDVSPELHAHIFQAEKLNTTTHAHYSDYYDPRLADELAAQESPIINRFCRDYGLGVIPWSPLASGLLAGLSGREDKGRRGEEGVSKEMEKYADQIRRYEEFCQEMGEKPADVALAWLRMANPVVTAPIIGPRTLEQLTGSLRTFEIRFSKEQMYKLDEIWPGPGGESPEAWAW